MAAAALAGCAAYRPLPLAERPSLKPSLAELSVAPASLPFPALAAHRFDPGDGLDMTEVAMLAVANNPGLKLARADVGIAAAQAFNAGLLPDPQLSLSADYPRSSDPAATTSAYNLGLAYELSALVTHAAGVSAAEATERKTRLDLLWQEWQVVSQARLSFSRAVNADRQLRWLRANRDFLAERDRQARAALAAGNVKVDVADAALVSWQDAERQVGDLERQRLHTRQDLNALLGLAPGVELRLTQDEAVAVPDEAAVRRALADLPRRRPDLLALKAGYAAQDARYRQAILAQFPPFSLGITRARDTSDVLTRGLTLSLVLPLLNGNRGNVRIEAATRRRLHDEYQNRLDSAHAEVENLLADDRMLAAQLNVAEAALPPLDRAAENARRALAEGDLDGPGAAAFESARIAKHLEVDGLRESLAEGRIALLTLLGGDFAFAGAPGPVPEPPP
jgi:outer membrane protein, heavy metal efflux system